MMHGSPMGMRGPQGALVPLEAASIQPGRKRSDPGGTLPALGQIALQLARYWGWQGRRSKAEARRLWPG